MEPKLRPVWPRNDRQTRRRFELLKRAYVEARYSKHYKITEEELAWLAGCVKELIGVVDEVCADGIDGGCDGSLEPILSAFFITTNGCF